MEFMGAGTQRSLSSLISNPLLNLSLHRAGGDGKLCGFIPKSLGAGKGGELAFTDVIVVLWSLGCEVRTLQFHLGLGIF